MKNDVDTVRVLLNLKVDINATNVSKGTNFDVNARQMSWLMTSTITPQARFHPQGVVLLASMF